MEDYKIQEIDPTIKCEAILEVIKSLPFTGKPTQCVGWMKAAETEMRQGSPLCRGPPLFRYS